MNKDKGRQTLINVSLLPGAAPELGRWEWRVGGGHGIPDRLADLESRGT